jgi:hypothetical protein
MADTLCPIHSLCTIRSVWHSVFMSDTLFMPYALAWYTRVWYFISDTLLMSSALFVSHSIYVRYALYVRHTLYVRYTLYVCYFMSNTHSMSDTLVLCRIHSWCPIHCLCLMHSLSDTRFLFHTLCVRKTQRQLNIPEYGCQEYRRTRTQLRTWRMLQARTYWMLGVRTYTSTTCSVSFCYPSFYASVCQVRSCLTVIQFKCRIYFQTSSTSVLSAP